MKKLVCLFLCLMLLFSLTACSKTEEEPVEEPIVYDSRDGFYQNPLTGEWNLTEPYTRRPVAFSVNNIHVSWPQYGVSGADIIFEVEAEGGITRIFSVFSDPANADGQIGSIRSLRKPFMEMTMQWDPLVVCHGESTAAQDFVIWEEIEVVNYDSLDQYFFFDQERYDQYFKKSGSSEHCWFTNADLIQSAMENQSRISTDWNPVAETAFNFNDSNPYEPIVLTGGDATSVQYIFSPAQNYDGDFRYDEASGKYLKYQFGDAQMDENNGEQLAFDNLFLLYADANDIPAGTYKGLVGFIIDAPNKGYYINGGKYEEISWTKASYDQDYVFTKADGTPLVVNTGKTHIGMVRNAYKDKTVIS